MYFFKDKGKQYLDLTGDLILSSNDKLVKVRTKSAGPTKVLNAKFVVNCGDLTFIGKLKASLLVLRFVWGKPAPLVASDTNKREPAKNPIQATTSPRDWQEDFKHENGNYQSECSQCLKFFMGHKRRVICKVCDKTDTETEGRMNCPVIDMHCEYFAYQCDRNGEIAISHCGHPKNKSETEGNCTNDLCPKLVKNKYGQ